MESDGSITRGQKENDAKSIQSIGDILREQEEFKRAMEVYDENTLNPLISLGHDPEGFYDEEIVGRIWLNKDDLECLL